MRKKHALIYLVACIVCATVAALVAMKFIGNASAASTPTDRISLLLATQDIKQGETISLTGKGSKGNVTFVSWPRNTVPAGGITDKKDLTGETLRARTSFVKNEVIQTSRLVKSSEYVPADMYLQIIKVDGDDLKNGRLRLGMKVDVLLVTAKKPTDFMRCGQIYAIGRLDDHGLPVIEKDPPPNVWVLAKKTDRNAFLEAEYGAGKLVVVQASDPGCSEPYLVAQPDSAQTRKKDAEDMLTRAKALTKAGQFEQALSVLDDLSNNYSDVTSVASQAAVEQAKTREGMAQNLYDRAKTALEHDQDFAGALRLLDELDQQAPPASPVRTKAAELREEAKEKLDSFRQKSQFEALTGAIDAALDKGDLPEAQKQSKKLTDFAKDAAQIDGAKVQPAEAAANYAKKVKSAQNDFNIKKQALEFFLKRGQLKDAQDQLAEMKKSYPSHPEIAGLEKDVQAAQKAAH